MLELSYGIIPLRKTQDDYEVLLIQHRKGSYWSFPKGHPEGNEDPLDAACRELKEETQLEVDEFLSLEPFVEHYQFERDGQLIEKTVSYFVALVSGGMDILDEEILRAVWFPVNEAHKIITFDDSKEVFANVLTKTLKL